MAARYPADGSRWEGRVQLDAKVPAWQLTLGRQSSRLGKRSDSGRARWMGPLSSHREMRPGKYDGYFGSWFSHCLKAQPGPHM